MKNHFEALFRNLFFVLLFALMNQMVFQSCSSEVSIKNDNKQFEIVRIVEYHDGEFNRKRSQFRMMSRSMTGSTIRYNYYSFSSIAKFRKPIVNGCSIFKNTDSIIKNYNGNICTFVESKNYFVEGKMFRLKKYYDDAYGAIDGEGIIIVNDSLGLVHITPLSWPNFVVFYSNKNSEVLINQLLEDTTGFIRQNGESSYYNHLKDLGILH